MAKKIGVKSVTQPQNNCETQCSELGWRQGNTQKKKKLRLFLANLLTTTGVFYVSFVAGKEELSGFQTGSSGDRIYFYYYPLETIRSWLNLSGFIEVEKFEVSYQKGDGSSEIHTILVAQKK
jgi:hypothetical protein